MINKSKVSIAAATLAAAVAFIVPWEDNKLKPYKDIAGIATACAGVTKGINFAKLYTPAECAEMNAEQVQIHAQGVVACLNRDITQDEKIALVSLAYNAGSSAICKSALIRKLNANEPYCDEFMRWNKAKILAPLKDKDGNFILDKNNRRILAWQTIEVRGLTNRREAEKRLCLRSQEA